MPILPGDCHLPDTLKNPCLSHRCLFLSEHNEHKLFWPYLVEDICACMSARHKQNRLPSSLSTRSMHNYLRITRILKCLGEMDYQHMQAPFVKFCIGEAFDKGTLSGIRRSLSDYWVHVVKDEQAREELIDEMDQYRRR